jgi:hypothetical protein
MRTATMEPASRSDIMSRVALCAQLYSDLNSYNAIFSTHLPVAVILQCPDDPEDFIWVHHRGSGSLPQHFIIVQACIVHLKHQLDALLRISNVGLFEADVIWLRYHRHLQSRYMY